MTGSLITTESGAIITTETSVQITADVATSNADIQQFDFSVDLLKAILWQYTDAVNLQALLTGFQDWYNTNQTQFWQDFVTNIFDLRTANEFGLAVWSVILDFPNFINQAPVGNFQQWGFTSNNFNFSNGNFVALNGGSIVLPIETQRLGLQLRYFQLCSSGTVPEINRFLNFVFAPFTDGETGQVFLADNHNMTQTYFFLFPVTPDLLLLFNSYDILPRPAGVGTRVKDATLNYWGFGANRLNFGHGNFEPSTYGIP